MRLEKIKDVNGQTREVNLDNLSAIEEQQYSSETGLYFGGYFVMVDQTEYERIKSLLEPENVLCELGQTDDPIKKFKEIVYRAAYLDSNAKLQLIIQLENIE